MKSVLTESDIKAKEQELTHKINEYYNFDMSKLKAEIQQVLSEETTRIDKERAQKQTEINSKF
jgi:outer membrane protein OmpA-like peptidoglycan-associated protein